MFQKLRNSALALLLAGATLPAMAQGVKIGANPATITPSAELEVNSTTRGFLPPRMTQLQINAIVNPATSLMAWCLDCSPAGLRIYDGTAWTAFGTSGAANATFTATSLNCTGTLAGTYQQGLATTSANTKQVSIGITAGGSYTISTTPMNGITFSGSGSTSTAGANTVTLTATGTPLAAGTFVYTVNASGQPSCTFSVTFAGQATFACGSATKTFSPQVITSSSTHSGTYTLPYTAGNGQAYGSVTLTQNGIAMTRAAGTYASGGGNVVYTFGGTHSGANKAEIFTLAEGCVVTVGCQNNIGTTGGAVAQMLYDNDGYGVNGAGVTPNYSWCAREVSITTTTPAGTQVWLDRNLGANGVADSSTDATSYGSLYQWGRRADGHQRASSTSRGIDVGTSANTSTASSTNQPANDSFIIGSSKWYTGTSPDTLWQGVSGVNNPCPSGFRLPVTSEFQALTSGWSAARAPADAMSSPIKMPLAGYRNNSTGALDSVGSYALYWSSTVSGTNASILFFFSGTLNPATASLRANGFTVRCIKN